jgi:hypothetical protein
MFRKPLADACFNAGRVAMRGSWRPCFTHSVAAIYRLEPIFASIT